MYVLGGPTASFPHGLLAMSPLSNISAQPVFEGERILVRRKSLFFLKKKKKIHIPSFSPICM